ncbi:MAG: serine/threonine-protein kinase [Archangium sp.]|nr:serine/threonine-protein kinase [Archangium sp.]MDP3156493.1 serine/threonine-protein kinase [Archangium sp.]MDP3571684.1 serine/threonine-protein kinase [Archangium sp.]
MAPKVIGPYRVLETLGSGGVGTVYRAIDRRTGEVAALKLLSTGPALDPRAARRLAREFETLQHMSHPNVVKVYDTGVFQGYPYLAMELVEGLTLRHYLALAEEDLASDAALARAISAHRHVGSSPETGVVREDDSDADEEDEDANSGVFNLSAFGEEAPSEEFSEDERFIEGPEQVRAWADLADEPDTPVSMSGELKVPWDLPASEERPIGAKLSESELERLNTPERIGRLKDAMLQLCEALAYIHGYGLIHRDLKPSNVMVDEDRTVRLMDFGLAKYISDDGAVTADGRLVGTFRYMAPEQILGEKLDTRTDLYSLGVILYELLAGRPPFEARTPYELWQKVLETEATPISALNSRSDRVLSRVAHRLIRKEPDDRFQTAEEVYEALIE